MQTELAILCQHRDLSLVYGKICHVRFNVRFKLRISQNRKKKDENSSKQFLRTKIT